MAAKLYGSVEAGGTKFVCGVGDAQDGSRLTRRIATRAPGETVGEMLAFFREARADVGDVAAFGVASFGPLHLDPASPEHGAIAATPKPGWAGVNLRRELADAFGRPVDIDSDVNAAALAEARAAGDPGSTLVYVTIGTGVGAGVAGLGFHGRPHPEIGHLRVRRHPGHGDFPGVCPFHGDCLEGLATGPALKAFWGRDGESLEDGHPAWALEAYYAGELCAALALAYRPAWIVVGGGVMSKPQHLDAVRDETFRALAGYVEEYSRRDALDDIIVPPRCREPPGLVGGYLLAEAAAAR